MDIKGCTALVTGANRGLGKAFAEALHAAGAKKIYAGARDPSAITQSWLTPVKLDVTSKDDIAAAAVACGLWRCRSPYQQCRRHAWKPDAGGGFRKSAQDRDGSECLRYARHGAGLCARACPQWRRRHRQYALSCQLVRLSVQLDLLCFETCSACPDRCRAHRAEGKVRVCWASMLASSIPAWRLRSKGRPRRARSPSGRSMASAQGKTM